MSTILKALRRLEKDDSRKPAAPLAADESLRNRILAEESAAAAAGVHDADPASRTSHRSASLRRLAPAGRTLTTIALLLFLAFFVGLASWYWIRDPAPPEPASATVSPRAPTRSLAVAESAESAPSGSPISAVPAAAAAPVIAAVESASPPAAPTPPPAPPRASAAVAAPGSVPGSTREEALPAVASRRGAGASPAPSRTQLPSPEQRPVPDIQPESTEARPSPPATRIPRNGPAVAPAPEAPTAAPRSSASKSNEAERSDPPAVPDIAVLQIAWHPQSDRRSTRLRVAASDEVLTLREGDAIGRLVVQEISPSAVVFALGDVEVRRRVGHGVP